MDHYPTFPDSVTEENLFQLQLKVAQRADEIAHSGGLVGDPWRCWSQAENEILAFESGPVMVGSRQASS